MGLIRSQSGSEGVSVRRGGLTDTGELNHRIEGRMGVYTTTEDVAFNELIELNNKTAEIEIKRITGNAISMIQGKNGQIWELLCEVDSLEDRIKEQKAVVRCKDCNKAEVLSDHVICCNSRNTECQSYPLGFFCADGKRKGGR